MYRFRSIARMALLRDPVVRAANIAVLRGGLTEETFQQHIRLDLIAYLAEDYGEDMATSMVDDVIFG